MWYHLNHKFCLIRVSNYPFLLKKQNFTSKTISETVKQIVFVILLLSAIFHNLTFKDIYLCDSKEAKISFRFWLNPVFQAKRPNYGAIRRFGPINLFILNNRTALLVLALLDRILFKRSQWWGTQQLGHTAYYTSFTLHNDSRYNFGIIFRIWNVSSPLFLVTFND